MNAAALVQDTSRTAGRRGPRGWGRDLTELLRELRADEPAALIVAIARNGDRRAFAALFGYFAPRVKSYMLRLGAAPEAAEELAQETLLSVWRKAALFDPSRAGASTWIFAIARNLRIDAIRRERRPKIEDDPTDTPEAEPGADTLVESVERDARLRDAIATLPADQAEVVRLSYFQDKPHSEIARDLDLPLGTVKSRLRLALQRLRGQVGDLA